MDSLFKELSRRNVFRVAGVYAVVGWLVAQMAAIAFPAFEAPPWVLKSIIAIIIAGFPIAMVFAWAFELTPEGMKRTRAVAPEESIAPRTGQKLDFALIGGLALVAVLIVGDRLVPEQAAVPAAGTAAAQAAPAINDKSIAVLPFADLSPDGDQEYFADGLSEELLNVLAQISDLKVSGRTSSFAYKGRNEDLREIGEALNVAYILEGSVRKAGNQIRVTAQLINTADGYHLFSDTYEGDLENIFKVQDEIASKITTALKAQLLDGEAPAEAAAPSNFAAYDLYLLARQRIHTRETDKLEEAVDLLDQALAIDNGYAPAYATKAMAVMLLSENDYGDIPNTEAYAIAEPLIEKAIALDPGLADGHAALGLLRSNQNAPLEEVARPLRRALSINPTIAGPGVWLGSVYRRDGRVNEALPYYEEAFNRDPLFRPAFTNLVSVYSSLGQYDKAEEALDRVERIEGQTAATVMARASAYFAQQRYGDAAILLRSFPEEKWDKSINVSYGYILTFLGDYDSAMDYADPMVRAFILVGQDDEITAKTAIEAIPIPDKGDVETLTNVVFLYHYLDLPDEAVAYFETNFADMDELAAGARISAANWGSLLAWAYRETGQPDKADHALELARKALEWGKEDPESNGWTDYAEAMIEVQSGNREAAIAALRAAVDDGYFWAQGLKEPMFEELRSDPRLDDIEANMFRQVNEQRAIVDLPPLEDGADGT